MATEDAVYRESSQFRLWSFSTSQLADLRAQTNALAHSTIRETRQRDDDADDAAGGGSGLLPAEAFLTPAEERLLLDFYTVELLRAGKFTEQPTDVQATAAVFFRRFYVTHSLMTYPPAALYKTALFFGAKAEGYYYNKLDAFAQKFPHTTTADILAGEFLLCQGIRFAFDVHHPFRALEGAIMELRRLDDEAGGDTDPDADARIANAHRRAREILKFSPLVTDAYFHYTPSQIMLAALRLADRGLADRLVANSFQRPDGAGAAPPAGSAKKKKLDDEWERLGGAAVRARVETALAGCETLLAAEPPERLTAYWGQPVSNSLIKPLLKKLKACHDPDRWDLVALQQAKREGAVKAYSSRVLEEDASVFGGSLGGSAASSSTGGRHSKAGGLSKAVGDSATSTPEAALHDAKRRKMGKALDDPFGPPL